MSQLNELDARLEQLKIDLSGPPDFTQQVLAKIANEPVNERVKVDRSARGSLRRFAALATAASLLFAVGWWMMQPKSLYAQAVAALQKVDVVHATGWATKVIRKWPLENGTDTGEGRHAIDAWYWTDGDRNVRSYEAMGPITITRNAETLNEYQSDADLLFVMKGNSKDSISRFETLSKFLRLLKLEGNEMIDLGSREMDGKNLRGTRLNRYGVSTDFWFDDRTNLPVSLTRNRVVDGQPVTELELNLSFDEPLPDRITSYSPPATENVRYGGQMDDKVAVWNQHVQNVGAAMVQQPSLPLPRIVERMEQKVFSFQHTKLTPDGRFWVVPLDTGQAEEMNVRDFVRFRVASPEDERDLYRWRVEGDLADVTFDRSDLVCEKNTPWQDWTSFTLATVGLEFTIVEEERQFWIAKHDGVTNKSYKEVNPPVPALVEGGRRLRGVVKLGVGHRLHPVSLPQLIQDFHELQNARVIGGTHPIIVDQTGLPKPPEFDRSKYDSWDAYTKSVNYDQYLVASDSPWFVGKGSLPMARQWYQDELGITFESETRKLKTYIVRRKK
ncbi:hypothetical protein K227x_24870 [Rubripirellula lacrimiformis]|uniref:Uncharacterized protein n=1 Tax=Rubripirellula lacrimiformis TaxID=1930273 RepID=A0A517NAD8_9BACT|nr:hypothetical protein [Rubripirellula lacrimiformis]QDT04099.1 hypothetical protein K227x_24870 [Rubripirellula lacrimiformis]